MTIQNDEFNTDAYRTSQGWAAPVIKSPDDILPSEWAARNLIVPDGQRAGGRWDPKLTPYVPDIIDSLGLHGENNFVAVRKGVQTGISMAGIALAASYIDTAPCRIGYALPTITMMQEFNSEKLSPCIDMTPALRLKVHAQTSRSSVGSTQTRKKYAGGSLSLMNANSATDLKSRTLRIGIADEVDSWPDTVGDDGDPFGLFLDRFTFFHSVGDWRVMALSTPTFESTSRIDKLFKEGDMRFWHLKCQQCDTEFALEFKHLEFNKKPPYEAYYKSQCCGYPIEAQERALLIQEGRFIATNPEGLYPSFHVDALISLVTTWDMVAQQWWECDGDWKKEQRFFNSQLGLPYAIKGDAPDWQRLYERREDYPEGIVPEKAILLVAGVDVQHNGFGLRS